MYFRHYLYYYFISIIDFFLNIVVKMGNHVTWCGLLKNTHFERFFWWLDMEVALAVTRLMAMGMQSNP